MTLDQHTAPPYTLVRTLANEGRYTEAAQTWHRWLFWREDGVSTLWLTSPNEAVKRSRQVDAEKARNDLRVFTEAMWADPSTAVGQLIATWPEESASDVGGAA